MFEIILKLMSISLSHVPISKGKVPLFPCQNKNDFLVLIKLTQGSQNTGCSYGWPLLRDTNQK